MPVRASRVSIPVGLAGALAAAGFVFTLEAQQSHPAPSLAAATHLALIDEYCLSCHDEDHKKGGLALDTVGAQDIVRHPEVWEKVIRKLRARQMPPVGKERPDDATYDAVVASLETSLDRAARANPNPGRTATIRRLTRTEYQNAVRDLLALDDRCRLAAARRRVELRVRQRDRRRSLADAAGPVHLGGGEDQPGRGRAPQRVAGRRHDQGPGGPHAGGSSRRPARRHARRGADPLHVPARRRVRDPDSV